MKNETAAIALGLFAIVIVGALALIGLGAAGVTTRVGESSGTPVQLPDDFDPADPRVNGGSQSSGWSFFGLHLGGSTTIRINFPVSRDCFEAVGPGDDWPSSDPSCDSDLPVEGTITQLEDNPQLGPRLVVEMDVSEDCYRVAAGGLPWPTGLPECAEEERAPS
jgi:hypothetical protein